MANIFKAKTLLGKSGIFSQEVIAPNLVYTTGNQIKSGRLAIGDTILDATNPYALSLQSNNQDTFLEILNSGGAGKGGFVGMNGHNFELYNWQGGDMVFFTAENPSAGFERLYIKNDGKIGVGTNMPSEKLEVNGNIIADNLVYNTGNQIISGNKTFINNLEVQGTGIFNALDLSNISEFQFSGTNINLINGNVNISGGTAYISGNPVLTGIDLSAYLNNLVYTTGNQTISGNKTFTNTGTFNTLSITNKKLSSYNYSTSNFIFGENYLNLTNSSTNITGTLPSSITSGINYYVKNLNSGILLITGSGQRTIDGFSTINLYRNESLQLLGVNNVGYTGWVTLSADNGVS